jgi:hypothetical protein
MATIYFPTVKAYLDAIAAQANNDISNSPHQSFWDVSYNDFINGNIPHVLCNGQPIPIVNKANPLQSSFYLIITSAAGFCGKRQMPGGGPFVTDAGYQIQLAGGTIVTGQQIQDDISSWLTNGFPEQALAI